MYIYIHMTDYKSTCTAWLKGMIDLGQLLSGKNI